MAFHRLRRGLGIGIVAKGEQQLTGIDEPLAAPAIQSPQQLLHRQLQFFILLR